MKEVKEYMAPPKVSVIIPTYNYGRFLPRALESVLSQTYTDYEIIVVDDGSTDETYQVVAEYKNKVKYLTKENGGVATARNVGIQVANGNYIAFLDADDAWVPHKLAIQVEYLDNNPEFGMVYADMAHYVSGRKVHDAYLCERGYKHIAQGWIFKNLLSECFIFTPTVLVRKSCFDVVGLHDPKLRTCQDIDMWLRIAEQYQIGFIDQPLAVRHDHSHNSTKNWDNYLGNPIRMFKKLEATQTDESMRAIIQNRLKDMYFDLGWHQFCSGEMIDSRKSMRESWRRGRASSDVGKYYILSFFPQWVLDRIRSYRKSLFSKDR